MKAQSKTQSDQFWKEHSERWKASGLAQKIYCEEKSLNYRSFVYQHNRLVSQTKKSSLNFIEAKTEPVVMSTASVGLHLTLPNGIRIGIEGELNATLLQTILTAAGGVSC